MKKELELWNFVLAKLRQSKQAALLVVAESSGSSPGRKGFKMAVADVEMCGSIGGGVMEINLVKSVQGKGNSAESKSKIVEQVHRKSSPASSGMICSGKQTVIFFELNYSDLKTIEKIIYALKNNLSKTISISNIKLQVLNSKRDEPDFTLERSGENGFLYKEKLGCKNKLFIIGGGHCALALSELMSKMDFHISLFDDRADLNTIAKNKFVDEKKIIESYEKIGDYIESGQNIYVVVMTLGYKFDEIVIRKLFNKNFRYFGVLGSKSKMKTLLGNLAKEGFDKEKLARIRTPIGLLINSRTPEEIAVSIAAEIIACKNP